MKYLLAVNGLVALGFLRHKFHERAGVIVSLQTRCRLTYFMAQYCDNVIWRRL